jgi:hypothetical protein
MRTDPVPRTIKLWLSCKTFALSGSISIESLELRKAYIAAMFLFFAGSTAPIDTVRARGHRDLRKNNKRTVT